METFTVKVSDRSMRRVQIVMAAVQASEQTAQAAAEAAQSMVAQARKSLDEALGSICDAHDEVLPDEYSVTLKTKENEITVTPRQDPPTGTLLFPPTDAQNGTGQSLVHERTEGDA